MKAISSGNQQQLIGRVKVGVRCRPAFQEEIDFAKGEFQSIVETVPESRENNTLGRISLTLGTGKLRDFGYDYVFGADAQQDNVYDRIARPVVTDVIKGFNGTIFAYGQVSIALSSVSYIVLYLLSLPMNHSRPERARHTLWASWSLSKTSTRA